MNHCNGPCDQGRKPCPCPSACGLEEPPEHDMMRVIFGDLKIVVALVGVIAVVVLVAVGRWG